MTAGRAGAETPMLAVFRGVLGPLILMSCVINVLSLTGSLYMLQIYDRVLTSQNLATLIGLSILAGGLFVIQGVLEVIRARIMRRVGDRVERSLMPAAHEAAARLPLRGVAGPEAVQPIRDVERMRAFLVGQGPTAIFDLPWLPIYVVFAAALHPILGLTTVAGILVLVLLASISEHVMRDRNAALVKLAARRLAIAEESTRNAEAAAAMGFATRLRDRFLARGDELLDASAAANDTGAALTSLSRVFRVMLQSIIIGIGAWLAIRGMLTSGAMIAASIVAARALAPAELAIANWRPFAEAREARRRLAELGIGSPAQEPAVTALPAPGRSLRVENLSVVLPSGLRVVDSVSFELAAGQGLGIIGPSAAGKSSLARALLGIWPATTGAVRIDGATLKQWEGSNLGRHLGYMPQDVQLFDGTIAENIARFETEPDSAAILAAAKAAHVHDMILRLPKGYDTPIGLGGAHLSAGQRQRIALARALYRDPFLVVLDEPSSNLDGEGDAALMAAIRDIRRRGAIVVIIAHRPGTLAAVDQVAIMTRGKLTDIGPRNEILRKVVRPSPPTSPAAAEAAPSVTLLARGPERSK
jgi:ATP-binding cassette subfamily C protein